MQHLFKQSRVINLPHIREPNNLVLYSKPIVIKLFDQHLQFLIQQLLRIQYPLTILNLPL